MNSEIAVQFAISFFELIFMFILPVLIVKIIKVFFEMLG